MDVYTQLFSFVLLQNYEEKTPVFWVWRPIILPRDCNEGVMININSDTAKGPQISGLPDFYLHTSWW